MATFISGVVPDGATMEFIRAVTWRVRNRASSELNTQACEDIASRMITRAWKASGGELSNFPGLLAMHLKRPRYCTDARDAAATLATYEFDIDAVAGSGAACPSLDLIEIACFLDCLDAPLRGAFVYLSLGYSTREIALNMGISKATAARHCTRAREIVRREFDASRAA